MKEQKYIEYLKCELTDAETADAARELAKANARRAAIEQQKKEVDSQLKGEIEAQNTVIQRLATLINTGHEFRNVECTVILDKPEAGKKTIVRNDTGEEVTVKPMTDADRQMVLDLEQAAADAEEKARQDAIAAEEARVIVTPPPVLPQLPAPVEVSTAAEVAAEGTWTDGQPHEDGAPLAQAAVMGGTHQKRKRGKDAAAGGDE